MVTVRIPASPTATIEKVVREEWGQVLAILIARVRDIELAEDVLQDALLAALERWPEDGVPNQPRAWLLRTATRRAVDRFRRQTNFRLKAEQLAVLALLQTETVNDEMDNAIADERLRLIFTCCHPALGESSRVALTLKTLGGLETDEIARAFLTSEVTLAQRVVRAKRKIRDANIPYRVPPPHLWQERLASVLSVLYLIFNEGYAASSGDTATRADLCQEAIRLARMTAELMPEESEARGLLALMLFHDSRRVARSTPDGALVTLEHQDRSEWDRVKIEEGDRLLKETLGRGLLGPYQIQAAISGVHAHAPSFEQTDWSEIVALYHELYRFQPSPIVELNLAVARSYIDGPALALTLLEPIEKETTLNDYQPFYAAKADLLRRNEVYQAAAEAYGRAISLRIQPSVNSFSNALTPSFARIAQREESSRVSDPTFIEIADAERIDADPLRAQTLPAFCDLIDMESYRVTINDAWIHTSGSLKRNHNIGYEVDPSAPVQQTWPPPITSNSLRCKETAPPFFRAARPANGQESFCTPAPWQTAALCNEA